MVKNAIFLFLFAVVVLAVFLPSYTKMQDLKEKNAKYEREIEYLRKKRQELSEERRRLEEDPEYLEKVAREKMGLIRDGEIILHMVPAKNPPEKK